MEARLYLQEDLACLHLLVLPGQLPIHRPAERTLHEPSHRQPPVTHQHRFVLRLQHDHVSGGRLAALVLHRLHLLHPAEALARGALAPDAGERGTAMVAHRRDGRNPIPRHPLGLLLLPTDGGTSRCRR